MIKKYFNKQSLVKLFDHLKYSENKTIASTKQVLLEVNLSDFKKDIKNMCDDEVKNKNLDLIAYLVEKILDIVKKINNQEEQPDITDMPPLETEEEAEKRQQGQGLKILTPKQMITRLPTLLAQLKAGNNSEKLKNEIRQVVYEDEKTYQKQSIIT